MLQQCLLKDLKVGMILGREVYEKDGRILIEKGKVLTGSMIDSLKMRPIFSVYIDVSVDTADIVDAVIPKPLKKMKAPVRQVTKPVQEKILDDSYVQAYTDVFSEFGDLFKYVRRNGDINIETIGNIVASGRLRQLCDGMRAITQIHNMPRDGQYLLHHSVHVAILSGLMGRWLNWPMERIQKLMIAGLLHDIGKLKISRDILDKPGRLTKSELNIIQRHPEYGYEMLRFGQLAGEREILLGVLQHHERNDGTGYPRGLKADEITPFGRILAIMDIYDAMVTNRVYARRNSPFDVFDVLSVDIQSGRLDTEYGILFIRKVCHALNGSWVMLSNQEKAKIVYIDESRINALPVVQTQEGKFIDLNTVDGVRITALLMSSEI